MRVASSPQELSAGAAARPGVAAAVKHVAGLLWYDMLSELNQNGMGADALGTGGDDFQSMFLWNIAQNDFGKYDAALTEAALRQMGGTADMPQTAARVMAPEVPVMPAGALTEDGTDAAAIAQAVSVSAAPADTQTGGDLVTQAKKFAKAIWPQLRAAAQVLGVPAVGLLAQSALETGWGNAAPGNNLFGIKTVDGEAGSNRATHEVVDGVMTAQTAAFRNYASMAASVLDYVGQIRSGFQNVLGQGTVSGFAHALQQTGYATDTNYAAKIISISQSPLMTAVLQALGDNAPNAATGPLDFLQQTGGL